MINKLPFRIKTERFDIDMEIPFLKNTKEGGTGMTAVATRPSDTSNKDKLIDMVMEEFMSALSKKDKGALKESLMAFMSLIQDEDEA